MRFVLKTYADGQKAAFETTDDGGAVVQELFGPRARPGTRIRAYLEAACDENEQGVDTLLDSLRMLIQEVEKRKGTLPR